MLQYNGNTMDVDILGIDTLSLFLDKFSVPKDDFEISVCVSEDELKNLEL